MGGGARITERERDAVPDRFRTRRIAGADRYATAARAARSALPGRRNATAVLATGSDHVDLAPMLAAARAKGMPVLYTQSDRLPSVTRTALGDERIERVVIPGPASKVSEAVASRVRSMGNIETVERIALRPATTPRRGWPTASSPARGTSWPPTASGRPTRSPARPSPGRWTPRSCSPSATTSPPRSPTWSAGGGRGPTHGYLVGGTAVLSPRVEGQLSELLP